MAHHIETMAFSGEAPWHFGETKDRSKQLAGAATWAEMAQAAGLSWRVEMEDLKTVHGTPLPGWKGIVRHRNGKKNVLGVASDKYVPLQPTDMGRFMDGVVGEKAAMYETAGSLKEGQRIWALIRLPGELRVLKDDVVRKYFMITTAFDGITATKLVKTPIRAVCWNTVTAALAGAGREDTVRIRHRGDLKAHLTEARRLLGVTLKYYDEVGPMLQKLAGFSMKSPHVKKLFDAVLPVREQKIDPETKKAVVTLKGNAGAREKVLYLCEKGLGADIPGVRGTAWGFYNSFTEWVDHFRKTKSEAEGDDAKKEARLNSQWFGLGASLKRKAFDVLVDMVK